MLKTIKLYGVLAEKFGKQFQLDVVNTREAMRALSVQVPGFESFMLRAHESGLKFAVFLNNKNAKYKNKQSSIYDADSKQQITGDNISEDQLDMNTQADTIHIVPRVVGAGGNGIFQTILGAVMVVVGSYTGQYWAVGMGVGMMIGGVSQMLMPKIDNTEQNQDGNRANKGFGSAVTTVAQGNPVPVLYGQREIGGFVISAGQYPEDQL
ncbi:tail assembly protein [Acinetobacter nosocomialis]|uniref:tail assembly protein n=1 Tax=Acinetobacter nosocomialis TaxID=106654 RepID=UPI001250BD22|nr:tail assembly protein [Acinetobacter nosocomialis]MBP1493031.1 tail assembly protein [Acinetobacter nosocomialis]MDP7775861.1 tail assembly protein [Acinetobacter nosocomialis]